MAAPAFYRIPPTSRQPIRALLDLSDQQLNEIRHALQVIQPMLSATDLVTSLTPQIQDLNPKQVESVIQTILEVAGVWAAGDVPLAQFADGISGSSDLALDENDRLRLAERLEQLIHIPSLSLTARAIQTVYNNYRVFREASVQTDLRPIFASDDESDEPFGAAVMHTLRLSYFEDGESKSLYISLDSNDLKALRQSLEQAEPRAGSLERLLERARLQAFSPGRDGS
jgi:hypothetical protein